jgi:Glutathione S-transferase, C-terminal domain
LAGALGVLQNQLEGRTYLLGESFTVADLNLASTLREPGEQRRSVSASRRSAVNLLRLNEGVSPHPEGHMAFILGVVFFVIVVGLIDARLPWPRHDRRSRA